MSLLGLIKARKNAEEWPYSFCVGLSWCEESVACYNMGKILKSILINNWHISILRIWHLHIIKGFRYLTEHTCHFFGYLPSKPMRWVLAAWLSKYLLMRFCLIRSCRSPWTSSICFSCQRIVLTTSPFTSSVAVHSNTDKHTFARSGFPCAWASVPKSSRYLLTRAKSKSTKSKEPELAALGVGACTSLVLELHKLF